MISTISGSASMPSPPPPKSNETLTEEEELLVTETLASYDSENLSDQDAYDIVSTLTELGIEPSTSLEDTMKTLGFDAQSIGDSAQQISSGTASSGTASAIQSSQEISLITEYVIEQINETLDLAETESLTEEQQQELYQQVIEKFGLEQGESIINTLA